MGEYYQSYRSDKRVALLAAGSLSLALTVSGCSQAAEQAEIRTMPQAKVHIAYFPDGTRRLDFTELNEQHYEYSDFRQPLLPAELQFCEDGYIRTVVDPSGASGTTNPAPTFHPLACADGKLTPSDGFNGPNYVIDKPWSN